MRYLSQGNTKHSASNRPQSDRHEFSNENSFGTLENDNFKPKKTTSIEFYNRKPISEIDQNRSQTVQNGTDNQCRYRKLIVKMDRLYPTVKWPLHKTWSFWYIKNDRSNKDWKDNLMKLIDVAYIEDFWSMYRHLVQPSNLETGADLALFKQGIKPMWEDVENKDGGRWLLTFNSQSRKNNELDEVWLNSILALIGDNFCGDAGVEESLHLCDDINGICVQNRPKIDKLSLWTRDFRNENVTNLIGFVYPLTYTVTYAHRLFHEPNQNFDRTSVGWVRSEMKLAPIHVGS
jgi:translation initiation factor 4E